jgi:hypothetical protein
MEMQLGCCCSEPLSITWSRYIQLVGQVTPNATFSDFTYDWSQYDGHLIVIPTGGGVDIKMAPVRYELGGWALSGYQSEVDIIRQGEDVGPRSTGPPFTGHLVQSTVSTISIPSPLSVSSRSGVGFPGNVAASVLRAAEIFQNGASIKLTDFAATEAMLSAILPANALFATNGDIGINLDSDITVEPDDVFTVDYYLHLINDESSIPANIGSIRQANAYYGTSRGYACGFFSASIATTRFSRIGGYSVAFEDNGPDGASQIGFETQAGWTYSTGNGIALLEKDGGAYYVKFVWATEIPYIEIFDLAAAGPSPFTGIVQYRPAASGDYDPITLATLSQPSPDPVEYGVWNPSASTIFQNRVRYAPYPGFFAQKWYSDVNIPSYFTAFPTTITLSPG